MRELAERIKFLKKEIREKSQELYDMRREINTKLHRISSIILDPIRDLSISYIVETEVGEIDINKMVIRPKDSTNWDPIDKKPEYVTFFLENVEKIATELYKRALEKLEKDREEIERKLRYTKEILIITKNMEDVL